MYPKNCSRCAKHSVHELIVVDLNPTITVGIQLLEGLCDSLDHNTSPDEAVERNAGRGTMMTGCTWASGFDIYPERG